jgi:WD40 repeat protein
MDDSGSKINMKIDEKSTEGRIVHSSAQSLTLRSAALVARGLRDLARDSNWLTKKLFAGPSQGLSISPTGQICVASASTAGGTQNIAIYNIEESSTSPIQISSAGESAHGSVDSSAVFAWSPTSRYLVAASGAMQPELNIFDLSEKTALGSFGKCSTSPASLAWSDADGFFAAAIGGGKKASLRVWKVSDNGVPLSDPPANTLEGLNGVERQTYEAEFGEEGAFLGYGKPIFSPDEKWLAVALEFKGDWADDSILIADVPLLQKRNVFQAQGHITDLCWTPDGRHVIYCAGGQSYRLSVATMTSEQMQFGAELCACHPFLPLCVCFSSWLKDSAKGRLSLFDLNREDMFDECAAEDIAALRWSGDGSKAYAVTKDGLAYVYQSPAV